MYKVVQKIPDNYDVKQHGDPIIVLEDEHGGQSVITKDDGCFILMNGSDKREFKMACHWYPEAINAIGRKLGE